MGCRPPAAGLRSEISAKMPEGVGFCASGVSPDKNNGFLSFLLITKVFYFMLTLVLGLEKGRVGPARLRRRVLLAGPGSPALPGSSPRRSGRTHDCATPHIRLQTHPL